MHTLEKRIPAPDGVKEVLKANIYERAISLNAQLAPLFPYVGPGAMVITAALQRGLTDREYGRFFHFNTQEEVSLVLGSNLAKVPLGSLICAPKFHGVTPMFHDNHDPEAFVLFLIIQRQTDIDANPGEQRETFGLNCQNCEEPVMRAQYNANPTKPQEHGARDGDPYPMFSTLWGCWEAAERFRKEESLRTCPKCGHVNEPFPVETWGWDAWVAQNRIANDAVASMAAAGSGQHMVNAGGSW